MCGSIFTPSEIPHMFLFRWVQVCALLFYDSSLRRCPTMLPLIADLKDRTTAKSHQMGAQIACVVDLFHQSRGQSVTSHRPNSISTQSESDSSSDSKSR